MKPKKSTFSANEKSVTLPPIAIYSLAWTAPWLFRSITSWYTYARVAGGNHSLLRSVVNERIAFKSSGQTCLAASIRKPATPNEISLFKYLAWNKFTSLIWTFPWKVHQRPLSVVHLGWHMCYSDLTTTTQIYLYIF